MSFLKHVSAARFAINVKEGSNTLFHMNPRWSEGRTVFNICHSSRGWGQPEYAFFSSLTPKANFRVEIVYQGGRFEVTIMLAFSVISDMLKTDILLSRWW